jgi:hypothetical protein
MRPQVEHGPPQVVSDDVAAPALRTFFRIADLWRLTVEDQLALLGGLPRSTYFKWKRHGAATVSRDLLERLSYIFGIYKALQILLPEPAIADAWIHQPNAAIPFGGRSVLDVMRSGHVADLYQVRQYLDAERGGWS